MTEARDTTDESISSDPGSDYGRNQAGDIVPVPENRFETLTDGDTTLELVEQVVDNNEQENEENENRLSNGGIATG